MLKVQIAKPQLIIYYYILIGFMKKKILNDQFIIFGIRTNRKKVVLKAIDWVIFKMRSTVLYSLRTTTLYFLCLLLDTTCYYWKIISNVELISFKNLLVKQ